jgi:glyoxylase-like metal-dependent hydrolase (beta-lactamase superfamily II)
MPSRHVAVAALLLATACTTTSHPTGPSSLGVARPAKEMLAVIDRPGPIEVETVASADWVVPRKGLINLDHPRARAAGLTDGLEPIQVYFHALRHPTRGLFLVDTGMERALRDHPDEAAFRGLVASQMHLEALKVQVALGDWLAAHPQPVAGVFLTHLHPDHLTGMADVAAGTPVHAGPGEVGERGFVNVFLQPNIDRALAGKGLLSAWPFAPEVNGAFEGVVDIFGDGSAWALWVPGHTGGSTAYLLRTPRGPVLLTGDACHTRWGWDHQVEPGSFSSDVPRSADSLARLERLVAEHPGVEVRLGHQR